MKGLKRVTVILLCLLLALSMAGCSGAATKMARAATQMEKLDSYHIDMLVELQLALSMFGQTLDVDVLVNEHSDIHSDPPALSVQVETEALDARQTIQSYILPEGEGYALYLSYDEGESWQKQSLSADELPQTPQYSVSLEQIGTLAKLADSFTEVGKEEIDGVKATRLDGTVNGEYVSDLLRSSGLLDTLGGSLGVSPDEEDLQFEGSIPVSLWVDDATGYIVRYDMDLTEALAAVFETLIQSDEFSQLGDYGMALTMQRVNLSATLSQFNAVPEIELPETAKTA